MTKNRTKRYLTGTSPKKGYNGEEYLPPDLAGHPTFVKRLSYKFSDLGVKPRALLPTSIRDAPSEICFFLDTNMWDRSFEADLWNALLSRSDSVFVIPNVRLELQAWIGRNQDFVGSRAVLDRHPNLILKDLPPEDSDEITAYAYYVYLLQSRRMIRSFYAGHFREKHGRDPDPNELMVGMQRTFGERGLVLAHKDGRPVMPDKWAVDESLVYFAAAHALETGRPTIILTKDQDVLEQFYKLWWFLDTHYRALLMADAYAANRFGYPLYSFPDLDYAQQCFEPRDRVLVDLGPRRMNTFLPRNPTVVVVECWLVRGDLTRLAFAAETEMYRLLQVKGATGGLVSNKLEGRNLHPWLAPLPLAKNLRDCVAVAHDKTVTPPGSRARVGMFDLTHAVNTHERFSKLVTDPGISEKGLWTSRKSSTMSQMGIWASGPRQSRSPMGLWVPGNRASASTILWTPGPDRDPPARGRRPGDEP
jgi:hypothetical protein